MSFSHFVMKINGKQLNLLWKFSKNGFQQFICLHSAVFFLSIEVFPDAQVSWFPAPFPIAHIRVVFGFWRGRGFCGKIGISDYLLNGSFQNNNKKSMEFAFFRETKPHSWMFVDRPDRPAGLVAIQTVPIDKKRDPINCWKFLKISSSIIDVCPHICSVLFLV